MDIKKIETLGQGEEHVNNPFLLDLLADETITPRKKNVISHRKMYDVEDGVEANVPVFKGDAVYFWHDGRKYSKVFSKNVSLIKGLSSCAMQMFLYILENTTVNRDVVYIKPQDFLIFTGMTSRSQYYVAAIELINKGILAKTKSGGCFFLNPCVVFNGNIEAILPDSYVAYLNKSEVEKGKIRRNKSKPQDWDSLNKKLNES